MRIACLEKRKGSRGYEFVKGMCNLVEVEDVKTYFDLLKKEGYKVTSAGEDGHWEAHKMWIETARIVTSDTSYFDNKDIFED